MGGMENIGALRGIVIMHKRDKEMQEIQNKIIKQASEKFNNALELFVKETLKEHGYEDEITKELLDSEGIVLHQHDYWFEGKIVCQLMRRDEQLGATFTIQTKLF